MDQIKLEELAVAYPDQEDLVQVYKEWGDSAYLQELFKVLDSYEPDWNKEKELDAFVQVLFCFYQVLTRRAPYLCAPLPPQGWE